MPENLSRSFVRYIREIDIIILGIGILLFVSGEHSPFSEKLFVHKQPVFIDVILFMSVYVFLTYDWIAYNTLIFKWPYKTNSVGLIRLYIDLLQLFTKALLVYLATLEITLWHLLLMSILFLMWHAVIVVWHWRLRRDFPKAGSIPLQHWIFSTFYFVYGSSTLYLAVIWNWNIVDDSCRYFLTLLLCLMIVAMSLYRQRQILAFANADTATGTPLVSEFDKHVARLRTVLETNVSARDQIKVLGDQIEQARTIITDLERRLSGRA